MDWGSSAPYLFPTPCPVSPTLPRAHIPILQMEPPFPELISNATLQTLHPQQLCLWSNHCGPAIISLHLHSVPMRQESPLSREKLRHRRLNDMPKRTHLVGGRAGLEPSRPCFYLLCYEASQNPIPSGLSPSTFWTGSSFSRDNLHI